KIGQKAYKLALPPSANKKHPVFHISKLELYHNDAFPSQKTTPPPPIEIAGEEEYELDEVIDSRLRYNKLQYRAKWTGYPPEHDHASMSFTVCYDDDCWIHASEKRDRDYYPRMHHCIPPPTSPLSSASEMSWNPDDHNKNPHTLQGRSEKKEGGKKLRKTVRWADETPTPTPPPSPSSTVTEVDTIEVLQRQATRMHDRQNQLEVDVRLYQGQQKMLNDTILSLRREKTELKTRITSLK